MNEDIQHAIDTWVQQDHVSSALYAPDEALLATLRGWIAQRDTRDSGTIVLFRGLQTPHDPSQDRLFTSWTDTLAEAMCWGEHVLIRTIDRADILAIVQVHGVNEYIVCNREAAC